MFSACSFRFSFVYTRFFVRTSLVVCILHNIFMTSISRVRITWSGMLHNLQVIGLLLIHMSNSFMNATHRLHYALNMSSLDYTIWASARQNIHCDQRRLRSACASAHSDQSSPIASAFLQPPSYLKRGKQEPLPYKVDIQAVLCWSHRSYCRFVACMPIYLCAEWLEGMTNWMQTDSFSCGLFRTNSHRIKWKHYRRCPGIALLKERSIPIIPIGRENIPWQTVYKPQTNEKRNSHQPLP